MDKTMTFNNFDMSILLQTLEKHLDKSDVIGYAAARNYRRISDAMFEYNHTKNELLAKYGNEAVDDDGNKLGTYYIEPKNQNYQLVKDKLEKLGAIEHEVVIFTISYEDVLNKLTGREIIDLDWMLDD